MGDPAGKVFSAIADPTRRKVIRLLSEHGPGSATELAGRLTVSRQAVSKHLAALADAGLVEVAEMEGREKRFRLTPAPLSEAASWMASVGWEWDERLEALREHVRRRSGKG